MKKTTVFLWLVVAFSFAIALFFYPQMPERMASHWNAAGEVNGHMPKFWGLLLMPLVSFGMLALFLLLPRIDPLKKNYAAFRGYYNAFIAIIIIFLFYVYVLTLLWNLDYRFDVGTMIMPAIAALFFYLGIAMKKLKRNWFIGIRTPWTLSSDRVWDKTHQVGSRLFMSIAVLFLISLLFRKYAIYLIIGSAVFATVFLFAYSYYEYRKAK